MAYEGPKIQLMERIGHLYKITRLSTGEYYYGIHRGEKFDGYWGSGTIIKNYIKTHGTDDLIYEIILIGPYSKILKLEENIVTESEVKNPMCWNLKTGGYRGLPSEQSRRLISLRGIGRTYSEERNIKIQESRRVKMREIGSKISASNKGKKRSPESCKKISERKLANMTDANRKRISDAKLGIKNPAWLGYVLTPDGIFESSMVAAVHYNKTDKTIRDRIKSNNPLFEGWKHVAIIPKNMTLITKNNVRFADV